MKLDHLLENLGDLGYVNDAKLKKVRGFLTPELAAKHVDILCQALAKFVPTKELDVISAAMSGDANSPEDVEFSTKMLLRAVTPLADKVSMSSVVPAITGSLKPVEMQFETVDGKLAPLEKFHFTFTIRHVKAKWEVASSKVGYYSTWSTKRLDTPSDALAHLKREMQKFEKFRSQTEKDNAILLAKHTK